MSHAWIGTGSSGTRRSELEPRLASALNPGMLAVTAATGVDSATMVVPPAPALMARLRSNLNR